MPRLKAYAPDLLTLSQVTELEKIGIKTVEGLVGTIYNDVIKKCGFTETEYQTVRNGLILLHSAQGISLDEYFMSTNMTFNWFPTGCDHLDQFLADGLGTGQIYEFFGVSGSGKTQLCLTSCYLAAATSGSTCIYLDTNNSFSSERILEISKQRVKMDDNTDFIPCEVVLRDKIHVIKCHELYQLISTLQEIFEAIESDKVTFYRDLRMIIIDSIASLLGPYIGNDPKVLSLISQAATLLKVLAKEYSIVVIVTNNAVHDYDKREQRSALGEYWKNVSNIQVLLDAKKNDLEVPQRFAKLIKSRINEEKVVNFVIGKAGFMDSPKN